MPCQIFIFGSRLAAIAALTGFATGDALLPADPRPRVTLTVAIQGAEYEGNLGGTRAAAAAALIADSLRVGLSRRFGFMNWDPGASPPTDTVDIVWRQLQNSPRDGYLSVRVRGATGIRDTMAILVEPIGKVLDRAPGEWVVPVLSRRWSQDADSIFKALQDQLVKTLFSQLSLSAKVRFENGQRRAFISLVPDQIRAAGPEEEEFRVRLRVRDAVSEGAGAARLGGCTNGTREAAFVCEITEFTYRGRTHTEDVQEKLRDLSLTAVSVHLVHHVPATVSTGVGGTVGAQ